MSRTSISRGDLPDWPALLDAAAAAAYVQLSAGSFRRWAAANGVRPVDLGLAVTRWRRGDLDQALAALPGKSAETSDPDVDQLFQSALAADRKRRR